MAAELTAHNLKRVERREIGVRFQHCSLNPVRPEVSKGISRLRYRGPHGLVRTDQDGGWRPVPLIKTNHATSMNFPRRGSVGLKRYLGGHTIEDATPQEIQHRFREMTKN